MSHQMNPMMMQSQPNLMEMPFVRREVWRDEMVNPVEMGGWRSEIPINPSVDCNLSQ